MKLKYLFLSGIFLISCKTEMVEKPMVTTLNVYDVVLKNGQPTKGKPLYKEAFEYNTEGRISQHFQYDQVGNLRSREIYPEVYGESDTIKTSFYNASNILQSNYVKIFNSDKEKVEVLAYEASTQELLRKEVFEYDTNRNLKSKKVYTADNMLYRHQMFEYDEYGNETSVKILDENKDIIFEETYDISTYDGKKMWIEKWGYRNGEPKSFRKRELEY